MTQNTFHINISFHVKRGRKKKESYIILIETIFLSHLFIPKFNEAQFKQNT